MPFFVVFLLTASVANKRAMIKNISAWKISSLNEYSVQIRLGSNLGRFFACAMSHEKPDEMEYSLVNAMSRELILKSMVEKLRDFYDFIIIECILRI